MRISIAMATYNGAKYIKEQIDSILRQTIQDFELVICDDCSLDDTFSIIKEYEKNDNRIHVYQNKYNCGFKQNFENVIRKCHADLIALSDQDDIWSENHLEKLLENMDDKVQVVCGRPQFINEQNVELSSKYDYSKMYNIPKTNEEQAQHILLGFNSYQGASMLMKRTFLDIALPIPKEVYFHDSWFAALACFSGGLKYVDDYVIRYRRNENAVTSNMLNKSLFRRLLGHTIVNHALLDRFAFVKNIKDRVNNLSNEHLILLNNIEKILYRRSSLIGRIRNIPYYLKNYDVIYATDIKHFFKSE